MDNASHTAKDEAMRYEIEVFKEKKKLATRRLKQLLKQKNQLCTLNDSLLEKVHKVDASLQEINDSYLENTNHVNAGNEQVAKNLEILNRQVEHALSIHRDSSAQATESFPSRVAPRDYFQAEEEFTSSLTAYTKRQFFEGIADMAGSKDKLRYEILEVSKPESLLIRGESEEVLQSKCEEMRRLQSIYTDNQKVKFESHCNLRRIQASLYKTEDIISKLSIEPPTLDVDMLSSKIADLQRKCEEKSREVKKIFDDKLIPLIEEMSELQTTKVLSGNFDLKIARQDYFTSKQDAVIDQLLLQNSRYEFLSMLYEVEAKCHRDTYNLLSTAKSILARDQKALEKRLSLMLPHTEEKPARETIDSRDFFVQNLFKAFDKDDTQASKRHFITCGMLKQNFEDFMINVRKQNNASGSADGNDVAPLDNARRQLADCTSMILGIERESQSDAFGEEMSEKISKIDDVLVTVEKSVESAISEIDRKKKLLASDSLKALERTLFTNFFNDPSRMKRIVTELKTRVEAMER